MKRQHVAVFSLGASWVCRCCSDFPYLCRLLHATSLCTKNSSHWPLIDISQDDASSNGNDYHHHDQPQHVPCGEKRGRIGGIRFSYSVAFRASKNSILPELQEWMDPAHNPVFVPSVPKSFFSLEFICTLWLIPMTGCTAAASLREGKVSAGSNTWLTSWEILTSAVGTGTVVAVASVGKKKRDKILSIDEHFSITCALWVEQI